jgi:hypothetical protein
MSGRVIVKYYKDPVISWKTDGLGKRAPSLEVRIAFADIRVLIGLLSSISCLTRRSYVHLSWLIWTPLF